MPWLIQSKISQRCTAVLLYFQYSKHNHGAGDMAHWVRGHLFGFQNPQVDLQPHETLVTVFLFNNLMASMN